MSLNGKFLEDDRQQIADEAEKDIHEEEEGQVDIELQKAMQNVEIDESAFKEKQERQPPKTDDSSKTTSTKKLKKNKGEDFMDYANKKGIQVSIQYEEDKHGNKGKNQINTGSKKGGQYDRGNKPSGTKNPQSEEAGNYQSNKYGKMTNRRNPKFGDNKFDVYNTHIPQMMFYDPILMQQCIYANLMGFPPIPMYPVKAKSRTNLHLSDDESILTFIENFFSVENLNKDLYIRNRINDNGYINASDIANYNLFKESKISLQQIAGIVTKYQSKVIEVRQDGDKTELRSKDWDNIKDALLSKEVIAANKKKKKRKGNVVIPDSMRVQSELFTEMPQLIEYLNSGNASNNDFVHSPQQKYRTQPNIGVTTNSEHQEGETKLADENK